MSNGTASWLAVVLFLPGPAQDRASAEQSVRITKLLSFIGYCSSVRLQIYDYFLIPCTFTEKFSCTGTESISKVFYICSMANKAKPTILDIARLTGLSKGTVDRVLHNRGEVSRKSYDAVMKAIQDLGRMSRAASGAWPPEELKRPSTLWLPEAFRSSILVTILLTWSPSRPLRARCGTATLPEWSSPRCSGRQPYR